MEERTGSDGEMSVYTTLMVALKREADSWGRMSSLVRVFLVPFHKHYLNAYGNNSAGWERCVM